jgi:AcrR family transcriptional regulator
MAAMATALKDRPKPPAGPSTREAILARAVDLASTDGLEGLTIGRLASDLGMSKSGLFGHFGSKEELQLATVAVAAERFIAEVIAPLADRDPGVARLHALCDAYIGYLEREVFPGGCFLAAAATEFDARPGPVRDAIRDLVAAWRGALEREGRAAGVEDPGQLAFELHAIAQGANLNFQLFGERKAFRRARVAFERLLPKA